MSVLDYIIVNMYKDGYSIKKIVDYVFKFRKRNSKIVCEKGDCFKYVANLIIAQNKN